MLTYNLCAAKVCRLMANECFEIAYCTRWLIVRRGPVAVTAHVLFLIVLGAIIGISVWRLT